VAAEPTLAATPPGQGPPGRDLGVGALLASAGLVASFGAFGINSIAVARIEGADGVGLVALSTQIVLIATFIAGVGLRTSVAYRVGAGLWSARSAIRGALAASAVLGLGGAVLGLGAYLALRHSALSDFSWPMMLSLLAALPLSLAWWIVPAVPLAMERFERYSLLTFSAPLAVLLLCPAAAAVGGRTGTVIGFAAGFAVGGALTVAWALHFSGTPEAAAGPDHGVREAGGFGLRAWVNDLFQFINVRPDLFILSAYFGTADAGVYSVTISITSAVWILSQPLASVVLPRTASLEAATGTGTGEPGPVASAGSQVSAVRHSVAVSTAATIAMIPVLAIAPLVWGPGFGRIPVLGLIMAPGVLALGVARVMVAAFTGAGAANQALVVGIVSFPLTVLAFLLVIPDHGATGAAVVSCCSYLVVAVLAAVFFFRSTSARASDALRPRRADLRDYLRLAGRVRAELLGRGERWRRARNRRA
jgi:O-antigen/teichoic acid export membrane protein